MPYPNFHSCRMNDPGKYQKIRYKKQSGADVVMGMKEGGDWEVQAIRYPVESFNEAAARASCGKHGGSFEAASGMAAHSDELLWMGQPMEEWPESEGSPSCYEELETFALSDKERKGLPDSSFADPKGRRFPYKNADGTLNRAWVIAAWAMANGARSGQKAEPHIIEVIRKAKNSLGIGENHSDRQVSHSYAKDLRGIEIFSSGTWNGDTYSEADLDAMVSAFHSLGVRPPVKLGHDEAQRWFGQKDGAPALGWVANLRRFGSKLVGDLVDIPDVLHEMITSKRYRTKSAEVYWNYKDGEGRLWPRVLRAVALLGADLPAVSNLQDLQMTLMADGTRDIRAYGSDGDVRTYSDEDGGKPMDKEQVKKYEDQIEALTKKLDTAVLAEKTANERAEKAETDSALKVFALEVNALVKEGKVLPAELAGLTADFQAIGIKPRKYGDKEMTWGQNKVAELKARPKIVEFKEKAQGGDGEDDKMETKASIHDLTVKIQRERSIPYSDARDIVRIEYPDAWKSYVEGGKG